MKFENHLNFNYRRDISHQPSQRLISTIKHC